MKLLLLNKKNINTGKGYIQSSNFYKYCNICLTYDKKSEIIKDIQKVLAKYFLLILENDKRNKHVYSKLYDKNVRVKRWSKKQQCWEYIPLGELKENKNGKII